MIQERVRAGLRRAKDEGKRLGRPPIAPELENRIREALNEPGRTDGVRKIADRFGVNPGTVQRISRPFDGKRSPREISPKCAPIRLRGYRVWHWTAPLCNATSSAAKVLARLT